MAWFRPMGADEVAYHQATVVGRADDHAGAALDYYGSRGETPLRWGGTGATRLRLYGEVTPEAYEAAFGRTADAVALPSLQSVDRHVRQRPAGDRHLWEGIGREAHTTHRPVRLTWCNAGSTEILRSRVRAFESPRGRARIWALTSANATVRA